MEASNVLFERNNAHHFEFAHSNYCFITSDGRLKTKRKTEKKIKTAFIFII